LGVREHLDGNRPAVIRCVGHRAVARAAHSGDATHAHMAFETRRTHVRRA
jgi:hypothetical protein